MFKIAIRGFAVAVLLGATALAPSARAQAAHDPDAVQGGNYVVEPYHTRVLFGVSHFGFSTYYGQFTNVSGSLVLEPKTVGKSSLEIHIPAATVSTTNAKLDGELKGDQWFDAAQFPEIVFKSDKVTETGEDSAHVSGTVTWRGVTRPVTLTVKFNGAGVNPIDKKYTVGFDVSGKIKRSDFGVKTYLPMVGDDVDLIISAAFERN